MMEEGEENPQSREEGGLSQPAKGEGYCGAERSWKQDRAKADPPRVYAHK